MITASTTVIWGSGLEHPQWLIHMRDIDAGYQLLAQLGPLPEHCDSLPHGLTIQLGLLTIWQLVSKSDNFKSKHSVGQSSHKARLDPSGREIYSAFRCQEQQAHAKKGRILRTISGA